MKAVRLRVEYLKNEANFPKLIKEHNEIYDSLRNHCEESAIVSIREHVKNQAIAVKDVIIQQG